MIHLSALFLLGLAGPQTLKIDPLQLVEVNDVWSVVGRPNNPVWPGWDARKTPILIYFPGKQDVLVNHPKPPAGFERYSGAIHSPIGPIFVKDGPTISSFDGQNTSIEVGGVQTLMVADTLSTRRQWVEGLASAVIADPDHADKTIEASLFPNPYSSMSIFAHEAFHVYQHKMAPDKGGNELSLEHYPSLGVENNVGFALESEYLSAALKAGTPKEARENGIKWLAVRQDRRGLIGKKASDYEDGTEFSEGCAKYVEYRLFQSMQGRKPSSDMWLIQGFEGYEDLSKQREQLLRTMKNCMSGQMTINNDLYGASPVRFRLYYSGMGVAALLDRLGSSWHSRIFEPGVSLTQLATEALHATPKELSAAMAEVKGSQLYGSLVAEKTKLADEGQVAIAKQVADWEGSPGQLILDYSKLSQEDVKMTFTPFGILRIDESRTLFRLVPISGTLGALQFSEDAARPVLEDRLHKALGLQLTEAPDSSIALGSEIELKELRLPGVTLKNVKGKILRDGKQLVIVLERA